MKTNLIYSFFVLTFISQVSYGQINQYQNGILPYDSTTTYLIELSGDRSDISNALNRKFLQKIAFGGYIDSDLKESVARRLDRNNYYRGSMNPGLSLSYFSDSKRFGYLFSYRYTNLINVGFSEDLFQVIFNGNSDFGDRTAILSKSYLKKEEFQSLSFGLIDKKSGSFLSLGVYDGMDYRDFKLGATGLATDYEDIDGEEFAERVYFSTRDSEFSESSKKYRPFSNGVGIGLSGVYNFEKSGHKFRVSVSDLGAIYWRDLSYRDTTGQFEFDGFEWSPGDDGRLGNVVDNLVDSLIPNAENVNKWSLLPGYVNIQYYAPAKARLFLSARALHYYGKDYYSEVSADLNLKYGKKNFLWLTAGFGDYSTYIFGLGTEFSFYKQGVFRIGTRQVLGLIDSEWPSTNIYFNYSHRL
ncbi:hypothetical protein G3O08_06685 [Cryomorpha ignava]|uniref:DUF5723 domain-containing protein n=1 Tax=Cryomorpha ignava TaxID=101383 RepID=A0A7K3WNW2_9FLAO|nr:hypothetical protein [Cryomorpha ignava]NEN23184.1 hypothetical protein [Cryomorpha ignava]